MNEQAATLDMDAETTAVRGTKPVVVTHDHAVTSAGDEASGDQMVSMIERIVMDPSVPIDRLERVLAMKERMEDRARQDEEREARKAYFAAMSECQAELPVVVKNQSNDHTKSRYADLAAIEKQAMPVIHRYGFSASFQPDGYNEKGELRIQWEISHREGYCRNGIAEIPIDKAGSQGKVNKTDTQAFGSTATYGRRYLLCMLFNISTGDDRDGNVVDQTTINADQLAELETFIDAHDAEPSKILAHAEVSQLADIRAKDFPALMTSLRGWAAQQKAAAK